jgi:acyl-CoA thioesterase-2
MAQAEGRPDSLPGELPASDGMLSDLLALQAIEVDMYLSAGSPGEPARLFGGQVAAQALTAAGHTVSGARPHSLHAYFLRLGDSSRPVLFQVDRLHDGATFRRRRVTAIQQGQAILSLESSFTVDDSGADDYPGMPAVPDPEDCPVFINPRSWSHPSPWTAIETRSVDGIGLPMPLAVAGNMWLRLRPHAVTEDIPAELVVTYLSDLTLAAITVRPTEAHPEGRRDASRLVSLDHSVWFHNQAQLSGWLLYAKGVPTVGAQRGIGTGQIFNQDGTLVATVAQEALLRLPPGLPSGAACAASSP